MNESTCISTLATSDSSDRRRISAAVTLWAVCCFHAGHAVGMAKALYKESKAHTKIISEHKHVIPSSHSVASNESRREVRSPSSTEASLCSAPVCRQIHAKQSAGLFERRSI